MTLIGSPESDDEVRSLFGDGAYAQLDFRVTLTIDDTTRTTLVSLWFGSMDPPIEWSQQELDEIAEASAWAKIGFVSRGGETLLSPVSNSLGRNIRDQIHRDSGAHPTKLFGLSSSSPSVLFFPANREWSHRLERGWLVAR